MAEYPVCGAANTQRAYYFAIKSRLPTILVPNGRQPSLISYGNTSTNYGYTEINLDMEKTKLNKSKNSDNNTLLK
jgi:hypothetical protein